MTARTTMAGSWLARITEVNDQARQDKAAQSWPWPDGLVPDNHQVELRNTGHDLAVTCSCLLFPAYGYRNGGRRRELIETRPAFPVAEAVAAWQAWHAERGIEI